MQASAHREGGEIDGHQRGELGGLVMDIVLDDDLRTQLRMPEHREDR